MKIRPNAPLLIGIGLPLLMVILVGASIYLPGMFAKKPVHNFVYSVLGNNYSYYGPGNAGFDVSNGLLVELPPSKEVEQVAAQSGVDVAMPRLYIHDVATNKSRSITFEEAKQLKYDNNPISPDGFSVINGGYGGGYFPLFGFSGSGANKLYIKKDNYSRALNLIDADTYYNYGFNFIGWVI